MSSGDMTTLAKRLSQDDRYYPCIIGLLILGLLLLFSRDLPEGVQEIFIPSLAVYVIGLSLIAWIQTRLNIWIKKEFSLREFLSTGVLHILWLGFFIWYNFHRC